MSEVVETISMESLSNQEEENQLPPELQKEVTYSIVKHENRWAILIENGIFKNFTFTIENMRLYYEDGDTTKIVSDVEDVVDKDVSMDFEYQLQTVPATYEDSEGKQAFFENVARNILIDILLNYPELYKLSKDDEPIKESE